MALYKATDRINVRYVREALGHDAVLVEIPSVEDPTIYKWWDLDEEI